ncbi:MAG: hypothetical protein AB7G17_14300 [Phycisphaerales bacterium]
MRYADLPGRFDATDPQWVRYFMRFPNALCRGATEALHADLSSLDTILVRGDDCVLTFNPKLTLSVQRLSAKVTNLPFSRDSKGWGVATALWTGRDGQQVIFSKGHAPAHHFIGRNRRAWVDGMKGWGEHIAELEARFPDALGVVAMDANLKLQAEKNRARIEAFFPGFEFTWGTHSANRGTRNRSVIDGVLTKGFDVASTHVYLASAGFDHRPSSHDLTPKKVTPVPPKTEDAYDIIQFRGAKMDRITAQALQLAEFLLGYELTITQGSYNKGGVSASAGTHDGGGVVDLAAFEAKRKVRILRALGFAAWHREAIPGLWPEHVHAVLIGNKKLAPAAINQVAAYRAGRDGLKSNAVDKTPRPDPIPLFRYGSRVTIPRKA